MKRTNTLLILFLALSTFTVTNAQRFLTEVFSEVQVTSDVVYGVNATMLAFTQVGEAIPEELKMDVYEPVGDNAEERPLVMVYHTGQFLPVVTNGQISGQKTDSSVVEICSRLARMGYTAASVDYRLGWNPLAPTQPERALGLIQAAYRGQQDGRACIRFFKKTRAEDGNPYSIDPNRVTAIGIGTSGYLVLALATLDEYNEILTTTNPAGKFLLDTDGDGVPDAPMVAEAYHGDIEGKVLTIAPDAAYGNPAGDTTNYPNHVNYSSELHLAMNVGGALGDISWLEAGNIPIITMQSAFDVFAPYEDAVLVVPTTLDPIIQVQGSKAIAEKQASLGNDQVFIDANIDDVYTTRAKINSNTAGHPYYSGHYPVTNPPNSFGNDEGVAVYWWDPNAPAPGAGMNIPWNMLPHPEGGTFHTQGLETNENMSAEKAKRHIDTLIGHFAPRAFAALDLQALTSAKNLEANEVDLIVAPNPVSSQVGLTSNATTPMRSIQLYDFSGKLLRDYPRVNNDLFFISRGDLPSGMYVIQIYFDGGVVTKKLVFE